MAPRSILAIVGTNYLGMLKHYKSPEQWTGGMLAVWASGTIYLSTPRRRVGKLSSPPTASDFLGWCKAHTIRIDKVYQAPTEFSQKLQQLCNAQEDAFVEGLVAHMLLKSKSPFTCGYCGYTGEVDINPDGWNNCPQCHGV